MNEFTSIDSSSNATRKIIREHSPPPLTSFDFVFQGWGLLIPIRWDPIESDSYSMGFGISAFFPTQRQTFL